MWNASIIASFFLLVLSVSLREYTVESKRYETVISWKVPRPWKCYQYRGYGSKKSLTASGCKDYCMKDDNCKMVQFLKPWCYLKDDQIYKTYSCSTGSLLFLKNEKKKLISTRKASKHRKHAEKCLELKSYEDHWAKSVSACKLKCNRDEKCRVVEYRADLLLCKLSNQRNFEKEKRCKKNSGQIFVKAPTPRWVKHTKECSELESSYSDFKVKDEAECKLKCYLDEKCYVVEFRPDLLCKLSEQQRFKDKKRCKNAGEIFFKEQTEKVKAGTSGYDRTHTSSHLILGALIASILRNIYH